MKIVVRNLGAVKQADIELKPLTILVGPNNAGKTWLAYMLAGILGEYGPNEYVNFLLSSNRVQEIYPELDILIQHVLDEGSATIDIVQFAIKIADFYFKRVANRATLWMRDYLGTKRASFRSLKVNISLTDKETFFERVLKYSVATGFPSGPQRSIPLLRAVKNEDNPIFYFYAEERISERLPPQEIRSFIIGNIFKALDSAIYSQVYIFPTERTTLLSMFSGAKMASPAAPPGEAPSVPNYTPLGNFIRMIFNILVVNINPFNRQEEVNTNPLIAKYLSIAHLLERGILNGELESSTSATLDILTEFLFKPTRDISLEMQVASSMVKELSPFVLYLLNLAKPGQLLVIDEPEMNLHPAAQVRFMELLAMLVNAGLHIIFTTHSSYMLDHLVNLIKAKQFAEDAEIQNKFFLGSSDAFLSKDQVSVFLFEDRIARNILNENGSIDWGTFSDVSDQVTGIFLDLVEKEVGSDL